MKRYKPYFNEFGEEITKTKSGKYKGVYKDKPRYFDTKEDAEKYEKSGTTIENNKSATKQKQLPKKLVKGKEIHPGDVGHRYTITKQDVNASKLKDKESGEVEGKYYYKDKRLIHKDNPYGVYEFKNKKEFDDWKNGTDEDDPDFNLENAIKHAKSKTPSKWED
jgi:hypothetical protein